MNEELLKELLMAAKGMDAPPVEPSARTMERLEAMLSKYAPMVGTESQIKVLILKILSNGRADGGQIAEALQKLKIQLQTPGEGLIFALLARMEVEETIEGRFNAEMTQKTYLLTERGSGLLGREASTVQGLNPLVAALWAV